MTEFTADKSLGSSPGALIAAYLREIGDEAGATQLAGGSAGGQSYAPWTNKIYLGTDTIVGFVEPGSTEILPSSAIAADSALQNTKLKITLDRFYVEAYPGGGEHKVLCEFAGKNQVQGETEELRFATTCSARDGQGSSILSLPIFLGLTAGPNGISFEGRTVNVRSSSDDAILEVLGSDTFKQGLLLIDKVQPAIRPLTRLAEGVVRMAASRSKNCQVHSFSLGLDFTGGGTSTRLRRGSYVVVQVGKVLNWDWSMYQWNPSTMKVVATSSEVAPPNWNYMVFGVSPYAHD